MIESVSLDGSEVIVAQLRALPDTLRTKIEKDAIVEANKILVSAIKSNVPVDSGTLQKSVGAVIRKYDGGKVVVGVVGPRSDFSAHIVQNSKTKKKSFKKAKFSPKAALRRPSKYAHLVEGGTAARVTKTGGNRGSVSANPFMERAIANAKSAVIAAFERAVKEAVEST